MRISYIDNRINISVKNVELKKVLSKLAEITRIRIEFPPSLKKKATIDKRNISLRETVERLLKDFNYVVLYSGPSKRDASVSRVLVYSESEKSRPMNPQQRRNANRMRIYERQMESLKQRLSRVDPNSSRGKQYQRRIRTLEKRLANLQRE